MAKFDEIQLEIPISLLFSIRNSIREQEKLNA